MNLLHLKYVVEVAKTSSISKAAENLYMGQPNLSRAIKELEESIGITIFERTTRGISITPGGEEFLGYARRIIMQIEEMEAIYNKSFKKNIQKFSICVPRASYTARAMTEFSHSIKDEYPAEIFYRETSSKNAVASVLNGEYNLAIIRYCSDFDMHFNRMFEEKSLDSKMITEFSYVMAMSSKCPLAKEDEISEKQIEGYIEISHADPHMPFLPLVDAKKAETSKFVNKHIFVFDRASQFSLLEAMPNAFMMVSPMPQDLLDKYNLVLRTPRFRNKKYKDVLIYRKGYKMTALDNIFIKKIEDTVKDFF